MSSKNKKNMKVEDALKIALTPVDNEEKIEFDAMKIQLAFLFKVMDIMDKRGMSKKDLAEKMGTSKSFVTQLFSTTKFLNMKTIAKLQQILDIRVEMNPVEKKTVASSREKGLVVAEKGREY